VAVGGLLYCGQPTKTANQTAAPPRMGPVSPPAAPLRARRARARARPKTRGGPVKTPTCDVAFERERDALSPAGARPSHVKRNAATQLGVPGQALPGPRGDL